jgi:transposase
MPQIKSWEVSDEFWAKVELLVPVRKRPATRKNQSRPGDGRKPMQPRRVFAAILYVLRTGCPWKALPKEFGSASAIHQHFQQWYRAGFFVALWRWGLAEYDEMEGIAWDWQSADGALVKAPLALECVGANPTDRGRRWAPTKFVSRRARRPAIDSREGSQHAWREAAGGELADSADAL